MKHLLTPSLLRAAALLAGAAVSAPAAWADKADRNQPMTIAADQQSTVDLLKQVVVFNGNVVITQGSLAIHADRVEVRESPEGFRSALAQGAPNRPATFRQKRDGTDEYIEGTADRVEYDGQADTVHFIGHAKVKRLRGATVADEINGNEITYNNVAELFSVQGGPSNVTPANPTGRVRAVLTPRGTAASAPAPKPAAPLAPSGTLGERR
ncbi:lipopolysaccharide transport periplasmic protein LptA [Ideonella sp. BN130291]|uniref:lipopolysaccharide transport periplasmic protein LptA n=1 Tax=Ideonella sp. BN130291 TaxID=3112940 RepID=UPI002E26CF08|nr:lipopolysaccharide transport periplasmic protein LptA [Ideonella sp. BN130291]